MKRTMVVSIITAALLLASCVLPGSRLGPGDKIGGMELTTEFDLNINYLCTFEDLGAGTCQIPSSVTALGVSTGWAEDTAQALDEAWRDSRWTMTIDGHKVDLEPFGTFDLDWGDQKARVWDVGLSGLALGEHVVRYDFYLEHAIERGNHATIYQFTVVPAPTSSP
jgi:hypothetical protein